MKWRLLIALQALEFAEQLPSRARKAIRAKLIELESHPEHCSEYLEYDANGRLLDACVCEGYVIIYWQDAADHQVKVLRIEPADS
jgi:mRNA-degrading endonuclease RelE of RelBE toxin-antitoxin system